MSPQRHDERMAESSGRPIEVERDGDPDVMSVVVAGRWTWLGAGAWWALLLGAMSWLVSEPPVRWFALGTGTVLAFAAARVGVPRETLTLEADALVSRTGSLTVRLPLEAINQVKRELVPWSRWDLWVGTSEAGIQIRPDQESLRVCGELGRRLEPRRGRVRAADDAAAMLGWEPSVVVDTFVRRRVKVVVGSAPRAAVCRAVLEALTGSVIQAAVGDRVVPREDGEEWRAFCEAVPWPERVELLGLGRDPLAVVEPGCTKVGALLTGSERAALTAKLPPGVAVVPVKPPVTARAARRLHDLVDRLAG